DLTIADVRWPLLGIVAIAQLMSIRQIDRPDLAPGAVRVAELETTWVRHAGEPTQLVKREARMPGVILERGAAERRVEPDARGSRRRIQHAAEPPAPRVRDLGQQPRSVVPVELDLAGSGFEGFEAVIRVAVRARCLVVRQEAIG